MSEEELEEVELFEDTAAKNAKVREAMAKAAPEQKDETEDDETIPKFEIPEKFQGKSLEDIIESYTNLEKEMGRKANEVGELRKLTDDIIKRNLDQPLQAAQKPDKTEVGFDDLVDDPASAVDKVIENNPRLKQLEESLARQTGQLAHQQLLAKHPDADDVVGSAEFANWLSESPARARLFQEAHQNLDAELGSDLLSMYKDTRKMSSDEAKAIRDEKAASDLKKATVEKGSSERGRPKKFKRTDLIRLKIEDPGRYESMKEEIMAAYQEGRVI